MAWFGGNITLGNFPDLAGAVNKLSESVKNIEKNFDTALGLEDKPDSSASSNDESSGLWGFMGHDGGESATGIQEEPELTDSSPVPDEKDINPNQSPKSGVYQNKEETSDDVLPSPGEEAESTTGGKTDAEETYRNLADLRSSSVELLEEPNDVPIKDDDSSSGPVTKEPSKESVDDSFGNLETAGPPSSTSLTDHVASDVSPFDEFPGKKKENIHLDQVVLDNVPRDQPLDSSSDILDQVAEPSVSGPITINEIDDAEESSRPGDAEESSRPGDAEESYIPHKQEVPGGVTHFGSHKENKIPSTVEMLQETGDTGTKEQEPKLRFNENSVDVDDSVAELEKVKKEMKVMEIALQGAARQAQAKADEIAKMMNENEQLKAVMEDLRRNSSAEVESLREEYHQRVAGHERKVYVLTRERDTLRREQNKKSDAAALLKEKDEIITQVMAEGEQLSKKQAAQESQIRKLRTQVRDLEEEKNGLLTKLEVEENKVESLKKDKVTTEKFLEETIEKHQAELATQKDYYTNALNAAKEAATLAEAHANTEAVTELESRLREAEERETMLVQALEELRQTLSRKEQQAVFREEMLQRDIEDLQKRYQANERRCEELITQVPESTRPLLRQIEAMQETTSRKAEAWAAVERSLNTRLQESESRAGAAEERERAINERLSQNLSRLNVLEAQISCLRAEQTQLTKSLEKERQRAAENRQEYLALKEEADTNEGRVKQLEEEIKELRRKHKQEIHEATTNHEILQQELEKEKAARMDQERVARVQPSALSDHQSTIEKQKSWDKGHLNRRLSSTSSLSSMEASHFLQASLDSSSSHHSEHRNAFEGHLSPYFIKSMTPSTFEAALRHRDGELASYMSRLASMESIRDSLAEELVKMTAQYEKLQLEATLLPGLRAELEALRRRHSAALELMGERDEELEELRADIVDLKEMYRDQVTMLVTKIQGMSISTRIS